LQKTTLHLQQHFYGISHLKLLCYATFDRGLAQAEKVGVRGVGLIKFVCVPGEHSAFIKKTQKNDSKQNEMEDKKKRK
jgi:cobalamin biosynthesis Co2+ chelatase CbiK